MAFADFEADQFFMLKAVEENLAESEDTKIG